jgi:hypothetical protein
MSICSLRLVRFPGLVLLVAGASASAVTPPTTPPQMVPIPLASHPEGQAMMQQAVSNVALDVRFSFLDKEYENDVWVKDKVTGIKARVSCVRFKANSGFQFAVDRPQYSLTTQGLTVSENISTIRADGLAFKFMVGPCAWTGAGLGLQVSDIKAVYKARPMISFDTQGGCKLAWATESDDLSFSVGDLNVIGVQNDLDKLAKDATREAVNAALDAYFASALRSELVKIVINTCGTPKKKP